MINDLPIKHHHYREITTTQDYAKTIQIDDPKQWFLVTADKQSAGKGQHSRKWLSTEENNIYATLNIPLHKNVLSKSISLPILTALSITQTLREICINAKIKWVNDVLVNKKKIAGVLCEQMASNNADYRRLLVGFGINVNATDKMFEGLEQQATSLFLIKKRNFDAKAILDAVVTKIHINFNMFFEHSLTPFLREIDELLEYKNTKVKLILTEDLIENTVEEITGIFKGINSDASLKLQLNTGKEKNYYYGRLFPI